MATVQLNNNNNKKDQDTCVSDGWCYLHRIRETYDNVKYIYCKIIFPHTSNLAIEVDSNIFSSLIFILYFICHMIYVYKNHFCER